MICRPIRSCRLCRCTIRKRNRGTIQVVSTGLRTGDGRVPSSRHPPRFGNPRCNLLPPTRRTPMSPSGEGSRAAMNSIPARSRAVCMASILDWRGLRIPASKSLTVLVPTFARVARTSCDQPSSARPARHWAIAIAVIRNSTMWNLIPERFASATVNPYKTVDIKSHTISMTCVDVNLCRAP